MASCEEMSKKRPVDLEGNDGRQKMRGAQLVPWDQSESVAMEIVASACAALLKRRSTGKVGVRGLVDALNRETQGQLTKRGEPYVGFVVVPVKRFFYPLGSARRSG